MKTKGLQVERRNPGRFLSARYSSCYVVFNAIVILGFCAILARASRLQIIEYPLWLERSINQTETTIRVPTYRGSIYDRQGRLLSYSVPQRSLFADAAVIGSPERIAAHLAPILEESEGGIARKLSSNRRFLWLKRLLTDQQAIAVEQLKQPGLNLVDEYKRFYPYGQVGGQVLGFVGTDGVGLEGVEKGFEQILRENTATVCQLRDGIRKCLWLDSEPPPEPMENFGVRLTLDAFIQYLAEYELDKAVQQYRARAGEVVILDAQTSEVLAMANWPPFDPNLSGKSSADAWRNRTITDSFEPGSTFKVFLVSAAMEEGVIKERDRIFCENGKIQLTGHTIKDVHPYGWLTIPEVIKYSSNIAATKIASQLGNERFYRYIRGFGFGARTGISLPGEVRGLVRPGKRWRPIDLAVTGFGQSIGVTSLQLTAATACLANGGEINQPTIVKQIVDGKGEQYERLHTKPPRRVIQKKTAQQVCDMMKSVTEEGGTGVKAVPDGYTAAGKTGTAQVLDPQTRRYSTSKWTSIFTGFIPADRPRLVITVVVHDPRGASYGGVVAAPVFRNISAKALPYLGVLPASGGPSLPPGLRMAGSAANKPAKTTPSSNEKKGAVGPTGPSPKEPKPATKVPAAPAGIPKPQLNGKTVTVSASIDEMVKPKPQVDLVMNRTP
jgi:cell division protein FtsI (penicillin-binding protein 3)